MWYSKHCNIHYTSLLILISMCVCTQVCVCVAPKVTVGDEGQLWSSLLCCWQCVLLTDSSVMSLSPDIFCESTSPLQPAVTVQWQLFFKCLLAECIFIIFQGYAAWRPQSLSKLKHKEGILSLFCSAPVHFSVFFFYFTYRSGPDVQRVCGLWRVTGRRPLDNALWGGHSWPQVIAAWTGSWKTRSVILSRQLTWAFSMILVDA